MVDLFGMLMRMQMVSEILLPLFLIVINLSVMSLMVPIAMIKIAT
jgi:hypothetical protein